MSKREAFIDHMTLRVRDLAASRRFYEAAVGPFGGRGVEGEGYVEFGPPGSEDLAIEEGEPNGPVHVAFAAHDRETVHAFYEAGLAAGGRDNGAPGERPQYHAGYYAAYVFDPDGNNVEVVDHHQT